MTFTSLPYFLFVLAILLICTITPTKWRWLVLLLASYFFYGCLRVPHLLIVLAVVTAVSYGCGLQIHKATASNLKKRWLWIGVAGNLSILIWVKYIPFLTDNLNIVLGWFLPEVGFFTVHYLVAIGVSYFIFQGISYLIDIYLEILEPENHPGYFALSMSFFPKLLQGPIERGGKLLPQLRGISSFSWENLQAGAQLFLWGMFKKVAIADYLATFVDPVYNDPHSYYGISLIVATYLFALQIYFDFSGYTDMALGVARCFNIRLTQNFNSPYLATSTIDFWRRWHISFSSWILDYIFKPVQLHFRDWPRWGTPLALMVTFIASGIWHGASWCFVVWGVIHGVYLSSATIFRQKKQKLYKSLGLEKSAIIKVWQIIVTFHLVCFSWIFFRSASIKDALYVSWSSITDIPRSLSLINSTNHDWVQHVLLGKTPEEFIGVLFLVALVISIRTLDRRMATDKAQTGDLPGISELPAWAKGCVYGILCYLIAFSGTSTQSFIYLQF